MNDALEKLEAELSKNQNLLSELTQQIESIQRNNESIMYTIDLLKKSGATKTRIFTRVAQPTTEKSKDKEKKTLRATILDSINDNEKVSVGTVWSRVDQEIKTSKATINTSMANLVKNGLLVRLEPGVYKKS